jgi:acyl-CoA synthetase (AMP-forming)/AMP-acid ligase II
MATAPASTLLDLFDEVLATDPDREAFVQPLADGTTRRTAFSEWATEADGLAGVLVEGGVRPGDVVAIELPSGIDFAIGYQAAIRAGAVATGINPLLGPAEVDHILERCDPALRIAGALPAHTLGDPLRRRVDLVDTDPVAIVWTGGTTGLPKGAWFDHACVRAMADGAAPLSVFGDRRLSPLPFAHVGYMTRMWDELVNRITTIIVPTPWTPEAALALLETERVTVCQGVPTQYRLMFDHPAFDATDVSTLRIAGIGASRIPPELVAEMREKLHAPVVVRYASTESCVATGTRLGDGIETICTTVGRPNGGVELRIADDDDRPVADGGVGNVLIRSRATMRGYWHDPERTSAAITDDGWVRTSDLGAIGEDGNLRLAGRSNEMYIRGGYNVYPIEVENCLGEHPGVTAAAVLGSPVDDRLGEIGVLFAVPAAGADLDITELRSFVGSRLASYKAPDVLVTVDQLPVTPLGKIDKRALQPTADQEANTWTR